MELQHAIHAGIPVKSSLESADSLHYLWINRSPRSSSIFFADFVGTGTSFHEYPACPEFAVVYFATRICTVPKNWRNAPIAEAVEVTMQNELRHQLTDYDQLMLVGVRRKEARRRVQPKISAIIAEWKKLPNS
ncbi:DUF2293 domain-containing protein [Rhizobium leguminosarum]